ncbi:hypothetical protein C3747_216g1 [Trypanosoma cruzi]|uniref:Uncharacterized protein n=1 Tax=Trypanosoma cruzi TaxID=5693 RepID=A0A2V2VTY2_TRYCR|nr:hypothetical protein C3747_216g1 [Trypanosoma cruzi]
MRRGVISYAVTDHATRALTLPLLLDTVRRDPGMTAAYYANRYFGKERQMEVTRVLWGELKFYGQVTIDASMDRRNRRGGIRSFPYREKFTIFDDTVPRRRISVFFSKTPPWQPWVACGAGGECFNGSICRKQYYRSCSENLRDMTFSFTLGNFLQ